MNALNHNGSFSLEPFLDELMQPPWVTNPESFLTPEEQVEALSWINVVIHRNKLIVCATTTCNAQQHHENTTTIRTEGGGGGGRGEGRGREEEEDSRREQNSNSNDSNYFMEVVHIARWAAHWYIYSCDCDVRDNISDDDDDMDEGKDEVPMGRPPQRRPSHEDGHVHVKSHYYSMQAKRRMGPHQNMRMCYTISAATPPYPGTQGAAAAADPRTRPGNDDDDNATENTTRTQVKLRQLVGEPEHHQHTHQLFALSPFKWLRSQLAAHDARVSMLATQLMNELQLPVDIVNEIVQYVPDFE